MSKPHCRGVGWNPRLAATPALHNRALVGGSKPADTPTFSFTR
jgi:hypothetical protein